MTQSLHIGHIHTGKAWGGGENQILHLLQGLQGRCVHLTLWARSDGVLLERARDAGVAVVPLTVFQIQYSAILPIVMTGGNIPDLLHSHDSKGAAWAIRMGRKTGIPVAYSRRVASPLRKNLFSARKYSPRNLAAVIAISETVRSVFARSGYPHDRIHVVPSGVDFEALDAVKPISGLRDTYPGGGVIVGIGKLSRKKNWSFLIQTAHRLKEEGMDLHWLIAGEGPEREALEAEARALGVSENVHLLGFRNDCEALLKTADLLFFPSLMEGASVTVRQAMALGTPVVAVNAEGTAESLDGHGWLVEPDDIETAARSVKDVLLNPEKREERIHAARNSARSRFTFDKTITGTLDVYQSVLKKNNRD